MLHETAETIEKAILVGVHTDAPDPLQDTNDDTMAELAELAETAGAQVLASMVQNRPYPDKATYLGEGKLEELRLACVDMEADMVIFDDGLTGSQIRNIEQALDGVTVIDRNTLILDIFAQRAKTREGKIQVELAQLRYMLPRLIGLGTQLSRLGGGIGTRGPGETKLESDRRHINRRIEGLTAELDEIEKHRTLLRSRREKDGVLTAAIVGYTNAGKSTLLNRLTDAGVTERNRLFETLDPTSRGLTLSDSREVLLVDTVGFIRRLPHQFIEAFKSTLEEAVVADVILHVVDASNPQMVWQMEVVEKLLAELGCAQKPKIAVFNKCDVAEGFAAPRTTEAYDAAVKISARTGEGIGELLQQLEEVLPGKKVKLKVCIPYSEGALVSAIHETELVLAEDYGAEGTVMEILADPKMLKRIQAYEVL